jgi:hypothetical protein
MKVIAEGWLKDDRRSAYTWWVGCERRRGIGDFTSVEEVV